MENNGIAPDPSSNVAVGTEGLPADLLADIAKIVEPQELTDATANNGKKRTAKAEPKNDDTQPSWAKEIVESNRTLQGEYHRVQGDVLELHRLIARLADSKPAQAVGPDELDSLESDDPVVNTLIKRLRQTEKRAETLEGLLQGQQQTSAQRQQVEYAIEQLREYADDLAVDFSSVERDIRSLPLDSLWAEGKKVIRNARSQSNGNAKGNDTQDRLIQLLKDRGLYDDERGGVVQAGAVAQSIEKLQKDFKAGKLDYEEYSKQVGPMMKRLGT